MRGRLGALAVLGACLLAAAGRAPAQPSSSERAPADDGGVRVKTLGKGSRFASVVLDKHCAEIVEPYKVTDNIASLKLARKVGFREVIDIHYRKYLGIRTWRYVRIRS